MGLPWEQHIAFLDSRRRATATPTAGDNECVDIPPDVQVAHET